MRTWRISGERRRYSHNPIAKVNGRHNQERRGIGGSKQEAEINRDAAITVADMGYGFLSRSEGYHAASG